jgi:hypothetical protein
MISKHGESFEKSDSVKTAKALSSDIKNDEYPNSHSNISECKGI